MDSSSRNPEGTSERSFQSLNISRQYRTGNNPLDEFYIPTLRLTKKYDRAAGYFDSKSLKYAARGIAGLISNNGRMRLITAPYLKKDDIQALKKATTESEELEILGSSLSSKLFEDQCEEYLRSDHVQALAWMVKEDYLDIKVAYTTKADSSSPFKSYHEKIAIMNDDYGNQIAIQGSLNETGVGWTDNYESFDVYKAWEGEIEKERVTAKADAFERLWNDEDPNVSVHPLPDAVERGFETISPDTVNDKPAIDAFFTEEGMGPSPVSQGQDDKELWSHQKDAIEWWKQNNYRGILAMATGSGKTLTALRAARLQADIRLTIIIVPSKVLLDQWKDELMSVFGGNLRTQECSGRTDWKTNILQVTDQYRIGTLESVHSLPRTVLLTTLHTASSDAFLKAVRQIPEDFLQIVIDEVHNAGAPTFQKIFDIDAGRRIGLSATPDRQWDEEGTKAIYNYFGGHAPFQFTTQEAIDNGYLAPYEYHPLLSKLTAKEYEDYVKLSEKIGQVSGQIETDQNVSEEIIKTRDQLLRKRAKIKKTANMKPSRFGDFLETDHPKPAIVFCEDTEQIEELESELDSRDISYGVYLSTRQDEQDDAMFRFENGLIDYLLAVKCLDEGVDVPDAPTAVIIASSRNKREFIQRRGRVLRQSSGKDKAKIFDMITLPGVSAPPGDDQARQLIEKELERAKVLMGSAENKDQAERYLADKLEEYGEGFRYLAYI